MKSAMSELRARTAGTHTAVDALFSAYDLGDRHAYGAFLRAHARALPAAEAVIARAAVPAYQARAPLLRADLKKMGHAVPYPLAFSIPDSGASAWGVLYVLQGSRIGGGVLAARVAANLPTTYLSARHKPGEWRARGEAFNSEARMHGNAWLDTATTAAEACFELHRRAGVP